MQVLTGHGQRQPLPFGDFLATAVLHSPGVQNCTYLATFVAPDDRVVIAVDATRWCRKQVGKDQRIYR